MSKVSEALEPWVYDPMYKGNDQPDQPDPNEGIYCEECEYWDSRIELEIDNQIKEAKLERNSSQDDYTGFDSFLEKNLIA